MSDCKKIDRLIWLYPNISESEKRELESHVAVCAACREAFEIARGLRETSERDKEIISAIDGAAFDAAVMRKIKAQKKPIAIPEKVSNRYVLRTAFSFAVAASVVLFLVKAISDLSEIKTPVSTEQKAEADRYSILNIELGKQPLGAGPEQAAPAANEDRRKSAPRELADATKKDQTVWQEKAQLPAPVPPAAAKDTGQVLALQRPPETTSVESPEISAMNDSIGRLYAANKIKSESPLSGLAVDASKPTTLAKSLQTENATEGQLHARGGVVMSVPSSVNGGFSILPAPAATSAPDSVNIGAIYVTNENVALNQQTRAASIMEIYRDSGSVQAMMPQTSVLVTVEQMPKPLKMVMPEYPVWAGKQGLSGTLWVKARVESDGHISDAEVISCDAKGLGFEDAALKAAKESTFSPASTNGINLPVWIVYPVKFIYKQ